MEDEHSIIPGLCRTEHSSDAETGMKARKGSGSDSPNP